MTGIRKTLPWVFLVIVTCIVTGCGATQLGYAFRSGTLESHIAIAKGKPKLKTYGLPSGDRPNYARLLEEELGVALVTVAGCVVWPPLERYASRYNGVTENYIVRHYGTNALAEIGERARRDILGRLDSQQEPDLK